MLLALDLNGAGNLSALYVVVVLIGASIDYSWSVTVCLFAYRFGWPVHCATLMGLQVRARARARACADATLVVRTVLCGRPRVPNGRSARACKRVAARG